MLNMLYCAGLHTPRGSEMGANKMINELKTMAEQQGDKLEFVSISNLLSLQADLEELKNTTELNDRQKWALGFSTFKGIPKYTQSAIIAAVTNKPLDKFKADIIGEVKNGGYRIKAITCLPLKRIAVQSGLGEYGRNNIVYVNGMGCNLSLAAFMTDIPIEKSTWRDKPVMAEMCVDCDICVTNCSGGAIDKERFLLDSQKCKKCSTCQRVCPMNVLTPLFLATAQPQLHCRATAPPR